jgi:hypothetical protein
VYQLMLPRFVIADGTALDSAVIFVCSIHGNMTLQHKAEVIALCFPCVLHLYHYLFNSHNNVFGEAHEVLSSSLRNFLHPPMRPLS